MAREYIVLLVVREDDVMVYDIPDTVRPGDTVVLVSECASTRGGGVVQAVEGTIHVSE